MSSIQLQNLALTQYYRWYQVYEIPFNEARIHNQLDILAEDVEISSQAGTTKGKAGLTERLKVYDGWLNAHHVQDTNIEVLDHETIKLEANILYQNIRPDRSRYSYTIHYKTTLQIIENSLPIFKTVNLQATGSIENPQFKPAYVDNRAKSFVHYWAYLLETAGDNLQKFDELLAPYFEIIVNNATIDTKDSLNEWLSENFIYSFKNTYFPINIHITELNETTIKILFCLEVKYSKSEDLTKSTNLFMECILENNFDERFARLKKMIVLE